MSASPTAAFAPFLRARQIGDRAAEFLGALVAFGPRLRRPAPPQQPADRNPADQRSHDDQEEDWVHDMRLDNTERSANLAAMADRGKNVAAYRPMPV